MTYIDKNMFLKICFIMATANLLILAKNIETGPSKKDNSTNIGEQEHLRTFNVSLFKLLTQNFRYFKKNRNLNSLKLKIIKLNK